MIAVLRDTLDIMSVLEKPRLTPEEYLALERGSEARHEYHDGELFAMTGGSFRHNVIIGNLVREIGVGIKGRPCRVASSDQRIHVPTTGLYTYPDVVVVCGEPRFLDRQLDTLLNPLILIEVLSPRTEAYDRGKKFEHYQSVPSLDAYLLVAQDQPRIDLFRRHGEEQWLLDSAIGLDAETTLQALDLRLALSEIYDKVDFAG